MTERTTQTFLPLIILAITGALVNLVRLPLVFESEWVFGGVAALVIAHYRHPLEAMAVAFVASVPLFHFWGSAWSGVLFSLEAATVAILLRLGIRHVVIADALYWTLIGGPLAYWIIFLYPEQVAPEHALTLTFKQAANGLICAHLASAATLYKPLQQWLRKDKRHLPVRPKLQHILARQLSVMLAILGLTFFIWDMQNDLDNSRSTLQAEMLALRQAAVEQIEKRMVSREIAIQEGAAHMADIWSQPKRLQWALNALHNRMNGMITMLVAGPNGHVLFASPPESLKLADRTAPLSVADRDYFRAAVARTGVYISDGFVGRGFGHDVIAAISTRIVEPISGKLLGVLEGSLDLATLNDLESLFPENSIDQALVLDRQNRVLFSSPGLNLPLLSLLRLQEKGRVLNAPTVAISHQDKSNLSPEDMRGSFFYDKSSLPWGWHLVVLRRSTDIIDIVETRMLSLAAGLAILAFLAGWFSARLTRVWVRPLHALTESVRGMPQNLSQPVRVQDDLPRELEELLSVIEWSRQQLEKGTTAMQEEIALRNQELELKNEQLERLAGEDPLTHLPNRRTFDLEMKKSWAYCQRHHLTLSLIILDLDHFKRLNDVYGHPAGDAVLKEFGQILMRFVKRETDLCARVGGEEFALLLPAAGFEMAMEIAEKLRKKIARHEFVVAESRLRLTLSAGVCTARPPDHDLQYLYKQADDALYAAKKQGRNRTQGIDLSASYDNNDDDL